MKTAIVGLAACLASMAGLSSAQHIGNTPEVHPKLKTWECSWIRGCHEKSTSLVLDSEAHPIHQVDHPGEKCGEWGSKPNKTVCPDAETCHKNCVLQGVSDYSHKGVTTNGGSLRLDMLSDNGTVWTPRVYLLSEDESQYEMLQLAGKELTFEVDVSRLPCGMNGGLYLAEMERDGGKGGLNHGGAYYGTGYCDAQCYTTPFMNGQVRQMASPSYLYSCPFQTC